MIKEIIFGQKCELTKLNQFVGHRVQITTSNNITFCYNNFDFELDCENDLVLMDVSYSDSKAYIPMNQIELIKNINNEDMFHDVIDIDYNNNRLSICLDN